MSYHPGPPPMGTTAPPAPPAAPIPMYSGAPVPAVMEPQLSGGWDQSSQPVRYHWFYLRSGEKYWIPFSLVDSHRLEEGFTQYQNISQEVSTGGGGMGRGR